MELVRKLPASHHFASHPAGSAGDADVYAEEGAMEWCTMTRLRRDSEQTPQHPNISPHISHAKSAEKHAASASDYQSNEHIYYAIRQNSIRGPQINPQLAQTDKPGCTAGLAPTHPFC